MTVLAGGSHIIVIQFTPRIEGEVKDVLLAALSSQYVHPKIAIALDDDIDPHDPKEPPGWTRAATSLLSKGRGDTTWTPPWS